MKKNTWSDYCSAKPFATDEYPFGPGALVFKVKGKMFALIAEDENPLHISLKCDPEDAQALRVEHDSIIPGYHLSKKHWNTLILDETLSYELVSELIDHSFELVVKGLNKKDRETVLVTMGREQ